MNDYKIVIWTKDGQVIGVFDMKNPECPEPLWAKTHYQVRDVDDPTIESEVI